MGIPGNGEKNAEVVRRYLRTFITRDLAELRDVMAADVEIYGAGQFMHGRQNVEAALMTPGLTVEQDLYGLLVGLGMLPGTKLAF